MFVALGVRYTHQQHRGSTGATQGQHRANNCKRMAITLCSRGCCDD